MLATILLVAIAVVLVAVLYILIAGVIHGSSTTSVPLGAEFYAGPAGKFVGTSKTSSYCEANHYCYSVPIDSASTGLTIASLNFKVVTSTGAVWDVSKNYAMVAIVNEKGTVIASTEVAKSSPFVVTSWETYGTGDSATTPVDTTDTIWIQFGETTSSPFGEGNTLDVLGAGRYSGSVPVTLT